MKPVLVTCRVKIYDCGNEIVRKLLRFLIGTTLILVWAVAMLQIAMPEKWVEIRAALAGLVHKDDGLYTIDRESVPLAGSTQESGKTYNGWLQVIKGTLANENGEVTQLRGMSSHGIAWYPQYTSRAAIETTKLYGANLFRVAMYVDDDAGNYTMRQADRRNNRELMYAALDHALALDMYAIADWHILKDGNPLNRVDCATAFFDELSKRYADEPGVIYEICNEPNGDTTWAQICEYADMVIPVIRANSPNAIIIVGTPAYSSDLWSAMAKPLSYDNIMYAYHYYSGISKAEYKSVLDEARKQNFPVFVSEWGLGNQEKPNELGETYAKAFIAYVEKYGISWVNWSLSNKAEPFSAIKPEVSKLSGWDDDDLTVSGKMIFDALRGATTD